MRIRTTIATPARLAVLFVCVTAMLLAVIGWLGWRLLAQERALDEQHLRDQLENTAALSARELDRALFDWETQLSAIAGGQNVSLPEEEGVAIAPDGKSLITSKQKSPQCAVFKSFRTQTSRSAHLHPSIRTPV